MVRHPEAVAEITGPIMALRQQEADTGREDMEHHKDNRDTISPHNPINKCHSKGMRHKPKDLDPVVDLGERWILAWAWAILASNN